jgi:hypothetical protein
VVVAVAGYAATFLTARYSGRRAFEQVAWLAPDPLMPALDALERLVRVRRGLHSPDAITTAEAASDSTKSTLVEAMRDLLGPTGDR